MSVFVLDIDGTICFERAIIAGDMLAILSRISDRHQLVLASARHPVDIAPLLPETLWTEIDIIGCNGAVALRKGELCHLETMAPESVTCALSMLEDAACPFLAYGANFVITGSAFHPFHEHITGGLQTTSVSVPSVPTGDCIKILCLPSDRKTNLQDRLAMLHATSVHPHSDGSFDLTAVGVDKSRTVEALGHSLPVFAAFGNDSNDLGILRASVNAVCVGSHGELVRIANHKVQGEAGVRSLLEEFLASLTEF